MATMGGTARTTAKPLGLVRDAAGTARERAGKVRRLAEAIAAYADGPALDARLARLERTFGTLPGAMRYFATLPRTAVGAALHLRTVKEPVLPS